MKLFVVITLFLLFILVFTIFILYSFSLLFQSKCSHRISDTIKAYIQESSLNHSIKILDLGCGSCCLTKMLSDKKKRKGKEEEKGKEIEYDVTSLDIVNAGKCSTPTLFDGRHIPFSDKEFDLGVCAFVLHHTPNQEFLLRELKRTCHTIIVLEDTPKTKKEWSYAYKHAQSDWGSCEKCFHTTEEWEGIIKKNGLKIVKVDLMNRWICSFARKPFLYPVTQTTFVLI